MLVMLVVTVACGDLQGSRALAGPSSAVPSGAASRTPRTTTATTLDCTVSWVRHYQTLRDLTIDAEIVVRAVARAQDTVQLKAFGANDVVMLRPAQRTAFDVTAVLRPATAELRQIRVLEDVCANLTVKPGEEWLLFAYKFDPRHGPDEPGDHYFTRGGPQGQFRVRDGKVVGPFYAFADVVHSYEGADVGEVIGDVLAVH